MPNPYGTTAEKQYAKQAMVELYARTPLLDVVNQDYYPVSDPNGSKVINARGQRFVITSLQGQEDVAYTGADVTPQEATEILSELVINNFRAFNTKIPSLSSFKSAIKKPESELMSDTRSRMKRNMFKEVLKMHEDAQRGQLIGKTYSAGTVAVAADGTVTGTLTTFTSDMVGLGFYATGMSKTYRIRSRASNTSIVLELDRDDLNEGEDGDYDGPVVSAGASYTIYGIDASGGYANSYTPANIMQLLEEAREHMNNAEVPDDGGRYILLPVSAEKCFTSSSAFNKDIKEVHQEVTLKGRIMQALGLKIYFVPDAWFEGDNTSGFKTFAGHKHFVTGGAGWINAPVIQDNRVIENNFGTKIKGLYGYGFKVADLRRKHGVAVYGTFNYS